MSDPEREAEHRIAALFRFSHRLPQFAALSLLFALPSWLNMHTLAQWLWMPCLGVVVCMFLCLLHPSTDQCPRCREETPDNPQAAVDRRVWLLWFSHLLDDHPLGSWVAIFVSVVAVNLAVWQTGIGLLYMPVDVGIVFMCLSTWRHQYLAPWCPYCRDDDGGWDGDHERIPDPDPVRQGTR